MRVFLTAKGCGYGRNFFVRRDKTADEKGYLYWLGFMNDEKTSSNRVRVSREFFEDFKKEQKRLEERWAAHKKIVAANFRKAKALSKKKPHCGRPACKMAPFCVCLCDRCDINKKTPGKVRG